MEEEKPTKESGVIRVRGVVGRANVSGNTYLGNKQFLDVKADIKELKAVGNKILNQPEERQNDDSATDDPWYKKPIGVVGLSVAGALITYAAIVAIKHYFP
ncbi:MAG: hypothetical protein ABI905_03110 [Betaproteobacteria bacterium]